MRSQHLTPLLAPLLGLTLLAGSASALAQNPQEPAAQPAVPAQDNMQSIEIRGDRIYKLAPNEFNTYVGTFRLDNGDVLKVWQQGTRYCYQLGKREMQEMSATSPARFVTLNGARLQFTNDGNTVVINEIDRMVVATR